ncbi:hypothetical protein LUZ63_000214 [Rhynchospora breviuscula]|uniref:Ionotropic glutamate receptor C-terminal domain-containing protein n=1 Tax=Rhynchospora breviuscula TaxID=2022672 RepID=A0A9Q0CUL8_9POAL|nr:hypothetical protein LUZ63_000214 [Rhynchospora breviuscula]
MQTRVFVVHMSSSTGSALFVRAKEVGMMSEGYVWIMTNGVTNMVNSFNSSVTSAMNGALGVRLYVPTDELNNFTTRWKKRFQEENPQDMYNEPSIYGLWAYDTMHAVAMAVENVGFQNTKIEKSTVSQPLHVFPYGPELLKAITNIKFQGLSGNFDLIDGQLQYSVFEIINVVGQGIKEVGYWRKESGLSMEADASNNKTYSTSAEDLNPVIWPGESTAVPKGWEIPVSGTKLRVGVLVGLHHEYTIIDTDPETNATKASGYSVDVFEEAVKRLPYAVPYEYEQFGSDSLVSSLTYNDFVYQVYLGKYDLVIGDITIRYNRTRYADFSIPYTESGVAMIVPVQKDENENAFSFLKPLTTDLWLGSIVVFIYTGIAILILEPKMRASLKGSLPGYLGTIMHLSLFAYQEKLENILSKIVVIVWAFVLLVLASSYTASLSSMLTVQHLQPTVTDIHELQNKGDYVGYSTGSFVEGLLQELKFDKSRMRYYRFDQYADALDKGSANGGVSAIVDEIPYIKSFLAKNCKSYTMVGPINKTAGFGFAFRKGSPLVPDISRAILNITDGEDIIQLEKKWIGDEKCRNNGGITVESNNLNFLSFGGAFLMTGVVSTICLLIFIIISLHKKRQEKNKINSHEMISDEICALKL